MSDPATQAYAMLKEFHTVYQVKGTPRLRAALLVEECKELLEAVSRGFEDVENVEAILKKACDVSYITMGNYVDAEFMGYEMDAIEKAFVAEEFASIEAAEAVINELLEDILTQEEWLEAFSEVHDSNMSKLDDDGQPIFREDGKVLKGPNFRKANLRPWAELVMDNFATANLRNAS